MRRLLPFSLPLLLSLFPGCIRPPDVILLDRKTVLEEQASGEMVALENELREVAITPRGAVLTRGQLDEAGADLSRDALSTVVSIYRSLNSEAELVDQSLRQRCVGEARNGLLVETPTTCTGGVGAERMSAAVQRVNRSRRQLWRHMQELEPEKHEEEVRRLWRARHLHTVVCGAQVQTDDGGWELKKC
jgi:hypothetical protein